MKENQIAEEISAKLDAIIKTQSDLTLTIQSLEKRVQDLENGEFVCGVKVEPKNIFILDQLSQNNVIEKLLRIRSIFSQNKINEIIYF